jgi:hypothetical protein
MGLEMWDQGGDAYNYVQLASNFAKLDEHDHTPGRGIQLTTESIANGSITKELVSSEINTSLENAVGVTTLVGPYTAMAAGTSGKTETPSGTRPHWALITFATSAAEFTSSFLVPAGKSWLITISTKTATINVGGVEIGKVKHAETITGFQYSYITL